MVKLENGHDHMKLDKSEVIQYLNSLCETQLMEVFYLAVRDKKRINNGDIDDAYCITNSGFYPNFGEQDTEFLALPIDWKGYDENTSKESVFSGQCPECKALAACIEVEAMCPICNTVVGCN